MNISDIEHMLESSLGFRRLNLRRRGFFGLQKLCYPKSSMDLCLSLFLLLVEIFVIIRAIPEDQVASYFRNSRKLG